MTSSLVGSTHMYKVLGYAPLVVGLLITPTLFFLQGWTLLGGLGILLLCLWLVFRDTLDLVQGLGRVYWLTRQTTARLFRMRLAYMRETDYPWRTGKGLQLVVPYRTFQIGICTPSEHYTVEDGLLHSLAARTLPTKPKDIREWL